MDKAVRAEGVKQRMGGQNGKMYRGLKQRRGCAFVFRKTQILQCQRITALRSPGIAMPMWRSDPAGFEFSYLYCLSRKCIIQHSNGA